MAQNDGGSSGRQPSPAPDMGAKVTLGSPIHTISRPESHDRPAPQDSSSTKTLPQLTKFSQARPVAKRGHSRLRVPWARAPLKPHPTSSPNRGSTSSKVHERQIDSVPTQSPVHDNKKPPAKNRSTAENVVPKKRNESPSKATDPNKAKKPDLSCTAHDIEKHSAFEGATDYSSYNICKEVTESAKDKLAELSCAPNMKKNDLDMAVDSFPNTLSNFRFSPLVECKQPQKAKGPVLQSPRLFADSTSQSLSPRHVAHTDKTSKDKPAPTPAESPPSASSGRSSDSGRVADVESNTEDEEIRPYVRSRRRRLCLMDHDDVSDALQEPSELESERSYVPSADVGNSDGESAPMSIDSPDSTELRQDSGSVPLNNRSIYPLEDAPSVITPYRARIEQRREEKLANFNSNAFDALIYEQSNLHPPSGVTVPTRSPKRAVAMAPADPSKRLALPVNPAIHRMHRRPEAWSRKKSKEIADRGGRKQWFGKVHERRRFLQAQNDAFEKERREAQQAGKIPPRRDPQPRAHKRRMDFGDVPDEELPEDVQSNPAWMKAVAWLRSSREQKMQRERRLQRSALEAEQFYRDMAKITGYQAFYE